MPSLASLTDEQLDAAVGGIRLPATFDPRSAYSGVQMQQGQPQYDNDPHPPAKWWALVQAKLS